MRESIHAQSGPAANRRDHGSVMPWQFEARPPATVRYRHWTLEELRSLAVQLQLRDAARKSRLELLDLLVGDAFAEPIPKIGNGAG
jgi:hypothetical protein